MSPFFKQLFLYTSLIAVAIFAGGSLPLLRHWDRRRLPVVLSLAAGLMLGSAFFHLIPESFEVLGKDVGAYILSGFLFLYFIERFITVHICEVFECEIHHLGMAAFIGLAIHTFINGVALGSGLMLPGIGLVVFLAILAHKSPEAFSLSSVLLHTGTRTRNVVLIHLLILLTIPAGALCAYYLLGGQNVRLMGKAVAFSAGTFLYISLSDLLPEVHKHSYSKKGNFFAFVLGLVGMWLLNHHLFDHGPTP